MKMKKPNMVICKECGKEHDLNETKRSLGKESMVVLLNMCSAQCYTAYITKTKNDYHPNQLGIKTIMETAI